MVTFLLPIWEFQKTSSTMTADVLLGAALVGLWRQRFMRVIMERRLTTLLLAPCSTFSLLLKCRFL